MSMPLRLHDPVDRLYEQAGEAGIAAVVRRFYAKVRHDDVVGPLYPPDDWEAAERRLRLFVIERFGGPAAFSSERGHPRLRMRHTPFRITPAGAERWMHLMTASVADATQAGEVPAEFGKTALPFFEQVATFLVNHPG